MVGSATTVRARRGDPVTSHEAAASTDAAMSQRYIYSTLYMHGPKADHELAAIHEHDPRKQDYGSFSPSRLRTARAELVALGKVEDTGGTVVTPSGRRAVIWAVSAR